MTAEKRRACLGRGIELFNAGAFFDFHECFEKVWLEETGDTKIFLQALIQIGVGFYHLKNNNTVGLRNQLTKGLSRLKLLRERQFRLADILGSDFLGRTESILGARTADGVLFPELPPKLIEIQS